MVEISLLTIFFFLECFCINFLTTTQDLNKHTHNDIETLRNYQDFSKPFSNMEFYDESYFIQSFTYNKLVPLLCKTACSVKSFQQCYNRETSVQIKSTNEIVFINNHPITNVVITGITSEFTLSSLLHTTDKIRLDFIIDDGTGETIQCYWFIKAQDNVPWQQYENQKVTAFGKLKFSFRPLFLVSKLVVCSSSKQYILQSAEALDTYLEILQYPWKPQSKPGDSIASRYIYLSNRICTFPSRHSTLVNTVGLESIFSIAQLEFENKSVSLVLIKPSISTTQSFTAKESMIEEDVEIPSDLTIVEDLYTITTNSSLQSHKDSIIFNGDLISIMFGSADINDD